MEIHLESTERGFLIGKFMDNYKSQCSIQESSLATGDCIWLGVVVDFNGEKIKTRMHLSQEHVKALLPHLTKFVLKGHL